MLHLLLGRDWTANRQEILNRIAWDVRQRREGRILMVPELISHETERRLAAAASRRSVSWLMSSGTIRIRPSRLFRTS